MKKRLLFTILLLLTIRLCSYSRSTNDTIPKITIIKALYKADLLNTLLGKSLEQADKENKYLRDKATSLIINQDFIIRKFEDSLYKQEVLFYTEKKKSKKKSNWNIVKAVITTIVITIPVVKLM